MMHPTLQYQPTPPSLRPYVPSIRGFRPTGHRIDLGYIPPEPAPAPVYRPLPPELLILTGFTPKDCLGCSLEFVPRSSNNVRCDPCAKLQREAKKAAREARKLRPRSSSAEQGCRTRAINQATRQRAQRAETGRQRQRVA